MPRKKTRIRAGHSMKTLLGKSKRRRTKSTHNPSLKASMKRKGVRLVHGYETKRRKG